MQGDTVRIARDDDLPRLVAIYNHYIEKTPITFDVVPTRPADRRARFDAFGAGGPHRLFVAERVGVFREVGRKFERYGDVLWMEKSLAPRPRNDGP